jgi:hypothetical protein
MTNFHDRSTIEFVGIARRAPKVVQHGNDTVLYLPIKANAFFKPGVPQEDMRDLSFVADVKITGAMVDRVLSYDITTGDRVAIEGILGTKRVPITDAKGNELSAEINGKKERLERIEPKIYPSSIIKITDHSNRRDIVKLVVIGNIVNNPYLSEDGDKRRVLMWMISNPIGRKFTHEGVERSPEEVNRLRNYFGVAVVIPHLIDAMEKDEIGKRSRIKLVGRLGIQRQDKFKDGGEWKSIILTNDEGTEEYPYVKETLKIHMESYILLKGNTEERGILTPMKREGEVEGEVAEA